MTQISTRKKLIAACALAGMVLIGLLVFVFARDAESAPPQRREYKAQTGNIIVGMDAAGAISSEKYSQFLEIPLSIQIKEYKVAVGDSVKKGDALVELSMEDIGPKLKTAQEKRKNDRFAVEKLKMEKQNTQMEQDKKISDVRAAGESAYREKAGALLTKKQATEQGIADKQMMNEQLKNEIAALQAEKDGRPVTIADYTASIAKLQSENSALQQKIEELTADTAADHTAEITDCTNKKIQNEVAISDQTREKQRIETADYDAAMGEKTVKIAQIEAEINTLKIELGATNETLKGIDAQRAAERGKEDTDIAIITKQGQTQCASYDNQISQAQNTANDAQKAYEDLLQWKENPIITAARDGVIVKLGYTSGAMTETGTPLAEIGESGKKILRLQVDPMDIADVEIGQEVSFYVDAYTDITFYGTVEAKSYLQNESGKFDVNVSFKPQEQALLDGMGANATLIVKQKTGILTLSNKAVFLEDGKSFVLCADEKDALQKKEITTGFSNGRLTEIVSGLANGDVVFVEERYENA
ncbi:MAG: HlyD family efflux transporter periplasmic adaptor subunit [Ruthenibacterium sp.]